MYLKMQKKANSHFELLFEESNLLNSKCSTRAFMSNINRILPTSKRSNSHLHFNINNKLLKCKRSQTAIEFVILVGFVLFFFTVFFLVIQGDISDKIREKTDLAVKEIVLTVQDEFNLALESTDGYFREFKLPGTANGKAYDIRINDNMVYVITQDNKNSIALPVAKVTIVNQIQKGKNTLKKENGEVILNQ